MYSFWEQGHNFTNTVLPSYFWDAYIPFYVDSGLPACVYVYHIYAWLRGGTNSIDLQELCYEMLWATTWVMINKSRFSAGETIVLHCWAISSACILTLKLQTELCTIPITHCNITINKWGAYSRPRPLLCNYVSNRLVSVLKLLCSGICMISSQVPRRWH